MKRLNLVSAFGSDLFPPSEYDVQLCRGGLQRGGCFGAFYTNSAVSEREEDRVREHTVSSQFWVVSAPSHNHHVVAHAISTENTAVFSNKMVSGCWWTVGFTQQDLLWMQLWAITNSVSCPEGAIRQVKFNRLNKLRNLKQMFCSVNAMHLFGAYQTAAVVSRVNCSANGKNLEAQGALGMFMSPAGAFPLCFWPWGLPVETTSSLSAPCKAGSGSRKFMKRIHCRWLPVLLFSQLCGGICLSCWIWSNRDLQVAGSEKQQLQEGKNWLCHKPTEQRWRSLPCHDGAQQRNDRTERAVTSFVGTAPGTEPVRATFREKWHLL